MHTLKRISRILAAFILATMLLPPALASAAVEPVSIQSEETAAFASPAAAQSTEAVKGRALEAYGQLPLSFIPNHGQVDERVGYYVQSGDQSLWFTADGVTMALPETTLRLEFLSVNPLARLEGDDKLPGIVNYFIGNDPARWRTNIPTYGRITYHGLWPGVDLTYEGRPGALKSTFTIAPGADPTQIRLSYSNADSLVVDQGGSLIVNIAGQEVRESTPLAWQEIDGRRVPVAVNYQVAGRSYSFSPPEGYDPAYPLVIDPELIYSTFLGGGSGDYGYAIAVDGAGNAYMTGYTCSSDFPITAGAFDANLGGYCDAFVVKVNAAGTGLAYATFLGGNGWDEGYAISVDGAGSAYVTGSTDSSDFPTTVGAFDTSYNGGYRDAFVVKVNAAGTGLAYATFLGGSDRDHSYAIAVDGAGNAYVTGYTESSNFPTTAGAFDTSYNGGDSDAFVVKLNAAGTGLTYATFLGGSGYYESGKGIVVDGAGNVYVTGYTGSSDFPTTAGAFDTSYNGDCDDAFVVKLNAAGTGLAYATLLGGSGYACYWDGSERGSGIAVDGAGNAYVTGSTYSSDFPTTAGAFDTTCGTDGACDPWYDDFMGTWEPRADAFVVKLNAAGTGLAYATFLGGSGWCGDQGYGIVVDGAGNAYVTGYTESSDFPTTAGAFDMSYNGGDSDAFVVKLNAAGTGLAYATFLGGSGSSCVCGGERGSGIVMDGAGNVYVTGSTYSSDFPTTPGAFDTTCGTDGACNPYPSSECGGLGPTADAFVAKLALGGGGITYSISGRITDGSSNPISGVVVSAGAGGSATTDAFGDYAITGLITGTYTLTPVKNGWTFTPATRTVSVPPSATGQDFTGSSVPTDLTEAVQDMATNTNTHLDQVLAEANEIAQDGDYFAVQKTEHEIDLIADAIIDSVGILADGFDAVEEVKSLTKIEFPGVIGRGWGHILDLKASNEAARNAFRKALQQQVTGSNARRAAKELLNGAHTYYIADVLDTAAENLLSDGMVKYGWKVGLQSDLALESQLYPAQQELVNIFEQDVTDTRDETIANMPSLTSEEQQAYIEDLTQRNKANLVMANTLERRALPLHLARDDRESGQGSWITNFLAKYLIKGLAYLYADGPGVLAVDVGSAFWNLYQNSRRLNEDIQMMNLAVEGMGGSLETDKRIYLNAVHGMDNILQGVEPQIAQGSVSSIVNKSNGEYKLFGRWWWCERSSYSEVNVSSSASYDTVYQVIANYGKTGFLGMSYQPLVSEGARAIAGGGSDTVHVYYKQDDEGASPDEGSAIEMDLLGSTNTGTYHVVHDGTIWQNPIRVTVSVLAQFILQDQADAPTIPYPIRSRIAVDEDALTYTPYIWVDNPFTQTVAITLTQPLPADVQVVDANGGTTVGSSLNWQRTISPAHTVEITHLVRYLGNAGETVSYPEPTLEMANLEATAYVTFTGEAETFVSQPPLSAAGTPPAEIVQGETATIPITVTNRLVDEAASGTVRLRLVDFEAETEAYSDTQDVSVPAGGSQGVELRLDTANISAGVYLLAAVVESNGGQEEVFAEYLRVKQSGLYLPIILKSY